MVEDLVESQAKPFSHALSQARNLEIGQADEARQRVDKLAVSRRLAQRVEAVTDLGARELAEVSVYVLDQVGEVSRSHVRDAVGHTILVGLRVPGVRVRGGIAVQELSEVGVESRLLDQLPNLLLE